MGNNQDSATDVLRHILGMARSGECLTPPTNHTGLGLDHAVSGNSKAQEIQTAMNHVGQRPTFAAATPSRLRNYYPAPSPVDRARLPQSTARETRSTTSDDCSVKKARLFPTLQMR